MDLDDVNKILDLPELDDISFDYLYCQMPLSTFCKLIGISEDEFMEDV